MTISARIRELRKQRDWTQTQLAAAIQSTANNIQRIERDGYQPGFNTLCRLARAFRVTLSELLEGVDCE